MCQEIPQWKVSRRHPCQTPTTSTGSFGREAAAALLCTPFQMSRCSSPNFLEWANPTGEKLVSALYPWSHFFWSLPKGHHRRKESSFQYLSTVFQQRTLASDYELLIHLTCFTLGWKKTLLLAEGHGPMNQQNNNLNMGEGFVCQSDHWRCGVRGKSTH